MTDHTSERLTDAIRQRTDVVRGHDAVHPNRNDCGGIGGCALMRAEHDAEEEVNDILDRCARGGYTVTAEAVR